jgi:hypothetical protein
MPEALFLFVQLEYPWLLGLPDGRYLLRPAPDAEPERVVVLGTLAAGRAPAPGRRAPLSGRLGSGRSLAQTTAEAALVPTARVTIVDPVPLAAERQAQAWIDTLDPEQEARAAVDVLNRILHFHRITAADPHVNEVSASQALVIRVGWGAGEQVADGRWLHARELDRPLGGPRPGAGTGGRGRRAKRRASLGHELRFAQLLGGRGTALICEELALRARLDLDRGRLRHAAIELDRAFASAIGELAGEKRQDLAIRIAELQKLHDGVTEQAKIALSTVDGRVEDVPAAPDGELLTHALGRLEAALRARAAQSPTSP